MDKLDKHRLEIDRLDAEILELLNKRAEEAMHIGEIKKELGKPLYVPSREKQVYERLSKMNKGPLPAEAVRRVYREIISASLSLEELQRIGFLGPEGTFTNLAAIKQFGLSAELIPMRSIPDVFEAVERGRLDYGIVPVENSLEGAVNHTMDMLADTEMKICGEIFLEINQNLMNQSGRLEDVQRIYSHPHAIPQCRKWLAEHAADIPLYDVESTAKAAEIASKDAGAAAIASEMAEICYGLRIIERSIEDMPNNYTRFLIIGRTEPAPTGNDKTSLVFGAAHKSGSLYKALEVFASHNINMTKIESRPSKKKAWEYIFYVDAEGHEATEPLNSVLKKFMEHVAYIKVLGSYPKGEK